MLTKNQLREIFKEYDFRPLKRFGENYLIDANIKEKIIEAAGARQGETILEIGPGLGALTIDLAGSGANVYAVEKDKKAFTILSDLVDNRYPNLKIFCDDILKFDLGKIQRAGKIKVVGNLPYYITTPIIEMFIEKREMVSSVLMLVQREVADRLLAQPGTKDYSSLSCFIRYYTSPTYLHTVRRASFYPEPEVDSSLVKLDFLDKPSVEVKDEKLFFKIVRGAFNQRRKTIMNSLSRKEVLDLPKSELTAILAKVGIDPSSRPETLSLTQFAAIANNIMFP
jgi:16S rRNA (adenine1518-N6/adenine1519-N6)-dimethyltransferase